MPGRNGNSLPYGTVTSIDFRSVVGWTERGDANYDYGAIVLRENLGQTVGWFGLAERSDAELLGVVGNLAGYPGDKPVGTQWYDSRAIAAVEPRKVLYDIDSAGGQSGGCVYELIDGQRFGIAIHSYGNNASNSGTRITTAVYNNLVRWKA